VIAPAAFTPAALEPYLASVFSRPVRVLRVAPLGAGPEAAKAYGYGVPLRIDFEVDGRPRSAVVETVRPGPFGHETMPDRAQSILWCHGAYPKLPRHVRSIDAGAVRKGDGLVSLGDAEEFFLLVEFAEGRGYWKDLERLAAADVLPEADVARADALCDWLVEIHRRRGPDPGLYARRLRELLGHGECIFGLTDSYPVPVGFVTAERLEEVERRCNAWRWKLKPRADRLRAVHGDFHPWNLLFREGTDFSVLDRSRGEWGEPADDVACLSLNYLFFALRARGRLEGPLATLFHRFWSRYVERSGDAGVLEAAAPFFAFRVLVMASPVWYPDLAEPVRRRLWDFMESVLDAPRFDPALAGA
jgi:streptomycin 6-kinase